MTVGAYPGGQAFWAQSRMALPQSALGHKQAISMAAQANEPAMFRAFV